ncbi:MAG: DUF2797 domain-containing protein [Gammaproteobacteria bacterium]|nr:DUF2797 domain-containing protein [Gammaproteobacteria bacterium]
MLIQRAGQFKKMLGQMDDQGQVSYSLVLGEDRLELNALIGKSISLHLNGVIHCLACNRSVKKSYQQGYCFPCTQTLAQCDICILRPELCHYRKGTCREPSWGESHCLKSHFIYLANSSGIKVGITRGTNIPTRWIDQGASQALPILEVKERYMSGLVEVLFKSEVADKTNWRKMLQGNPESVDLLALRDQLFAKLQPELHKLDAQFNGQALTYLPEAKVLEFHYPVVEYPTSIKKADFDEQGVLNATLLGIKGQYWLFDRGVMNMRNLLGQHLSVEAVL